jgi:DNA-directed RNA polymerase specialized sigma24 family protein
MTSHRQTEPNRDPAWARVWEAHRPWLRTVALARSRDPSAVEENLQEVSLAVARQGGLPDDEELAAPWLYRVTVLQALLHRRGLGRRRRLALRYAAEVYGSPDDDGRSNRVAVGEGRSPANGVDPLGWMLHEESRRLVRVAVGRLSTRDAESNRDWNGLGRICVGSSAGSIWLRKRRPRRRHVSPTPEKNDFDEIVTRDVPERRLPHPLRNRLRTANWTTPCCVTVWGGSIANRVGGVAWRWRSWSRR